MMIMVTNFGEKQNATVKLDTKKLGWAGAAIAVTDAEAGYKNETSVKKTEEEIAAEKAQFDKDEAARKEQNPKYKGKTFQPKRAKKVTTWKATRTSP